MAESSVKKPAGGLLDRVGGILDGKALFSDGKDAPAGEADAKKGGLLKALGESKHCTLCEKAFGLTVKSRTCHACDLEVCQDCSLSTCTRCHTAKSTTDQQTTQDFELLWQQTQVRLAEIPKMQEELEELRREAASLKEQLEEEKSRGADAKAEVSQLRADLADAHAALEAEKAEASEARVAYEQELAEQKAKSEEEQKALQGKLSELSEQLLTSMIEPVKREG